MTDTAVTDMRLAAYTAALAAIRAAIDANDAAAVEYGPASEWREPPEFVTADEKTGDRVLLPAPDNPEVSAGRIARALADDELGIARDAVDKAYDMLSRIIADLVAAGSLQRGDRIITPWSWPDELRVAEIRNPGARDLSTAVLTADGGRVHNDRHNFALDDDGRIIDDGIAPIHYEQWWCRGLRFSGTAHPLSRGMIDVEVAG